MAAEAPDALRVVGHLGPIKKGKLDGWAWTPDEPDARLKVTVLIDGESVYTAIASELFPSLLRRSIGDGAHGFSIQLSNDHADIAVERIEVLAAHASLGSPPSETEDESSVPATTGRVGDVTDGTLSGWAWDPRHPEDRLTITVSLDGQEIAHGVASEVFPGLVAGGIGDGGHGFTIALPPVYAATDPQRLAVVAGPDAYPLEITARPPETFVAEEPPVADGPVGVAVLTGRAGWLFELSREQLQVLGDQPADPESGERLRRHAGQLDKTAQELHRLGIHYVVAVVPQKLAVYRNRLPSPLPRALRRTWRASYLARLTHALDHVEVHDLLPHLLAATAAGQALYLPQDEVLSARGAFVIHRALLKRAGLAVRGLAPLQIANVAFTWSLVAAPRSSASLPLLSPDGKLTTLPESDDQGDAEPTEIADPSTLRARRMPAGEHLELEGVAAPRVYEHQDLDGPPRVVLLGSRAVNLRLAPWIAETTSRLVVLDTPDVPLEPIELEKPDLVLHVLDEWELMLRPTP